MHFCNYLMHLVMHKVGFLLIDAEYVIIDGFCCSDNLMHFGMPDFRV